MKRILIYVLTPVVIFLSMGTVLAQTIPTLSPWYFLNNATITTRVNTNSVQIPSLANGSGECIAADPSGNLYIKTCGSGGGGLASSSPFLQGYLTMITATGTLTDSPVYSTSSDIGIGTTNPSTTLDVNGSSTFRNQVYIPLSIGGCLTAGTNGLVATTTCLSTAVTSISSANGFLSFNNSTGAVTATASATPTYAQSTSTLFFSNVGNFNQINDSGATSTECDYGSGALGTITGENCVQSLNGLTGNVTATGTTNQIAEATGTGNLVFSFPNNSITVTDATVTSLFLPSDIGGCITAGAGGFTSTTTCNSSGVTSINSANALLSFSAATGNVTTTVSTSSIEGLFSATPPLQYSSGALSWGGITTSTAPTASTVPMWYGTGGGLTNSMLTQNAAATLLTITGSTTITGTASTTNLTVSGTSTFAGAIFSNDLTVTNKITGSISGNADGSSGSTTGNAATVTTNANLTGPITSVGNATTRTLLANSNLDLPEGFLINGKIVPSVTSNNLTVAIKGLDGNDPSASNPVYCRIGGVIRTISAALSITTNAGTDWFNAGSAELATQEIDYFAYLGYNATDGVVLGFARIPYGTSYSDFSATNTNEKFAAISTITHAASTDYYNNIGRFAATLSAGAGYTWSVPTFTASNLINRPIYETRTLSFLSIGTGFSSGGNQTKTYKIIGKDLMVYAGTFGDGTSNATTFTGTLPFATTLTSSCAFGTQGYQDNGGYGAGANAISSGNNVLTFFKQFFNTAWTASGGKAIYHGTFTLPI